MQFLVILILLIPQLYALELVTKYAAECQDRRTWESFRDCGAATYYFQGKCEEAAAEIKLFSSSPPICECVEAICRTEVNSHLSPNQQRLLKKPHPASDIPNCHNTTLQSLGFSSGASTQSHPAMYFLIDSPYCSVHEGKPRPGDIIWYSHDHSYQALTEKFAFNKSSPGANAPYELIQIDQYFQVNRDDVSCQFVGSEVAVSQGCHTTSQAITCDLPEDVKQFISLSPDDLEKVRTFDDLTYRESVLGEKVNQNIEDLEKVMNELARERLGIPEPKDVSPDLIKQFRAALISSVPQDEQQPMAEYFDRFQRNFMANLFVISSPDIRTPYSPEITQVIKLARKMKYYSPLPLEQRLAWGILLLDGNSSSMPRKDFPVLAPHPEDSKAI